MFTGNRGCLVNDHGQVVRHHAGSLWITCLTEYRDWQHPLAAPRTWTPLFFLDDAVALAAGHRPCGLCRRGDYLLYRQAVTQASNATSPVLAKELNRRLAQQRHRPGRGLVRGHDRIVETRPIDSLPTGAVIADPTDGEAALVAGANLQRFCFDGWAPPVDRPAGTMVKVLTPPTSLAALTNGFRPRLHESAELAG